MKRAAVAVAFLISSFTLAAQNDAKPQALTLYHPSSQVAGTCPIVMGADQGVWDHTIRVREGDREHAVQPFGQKISLFLKDSHSARILAATVRVDGLTGKTRELQTDAKTLDTDGIRTLRVKFTSQDDGLVLADLWLPGFTSVTSIELMEVTYADGSAWKISGSNVCRVQPNPLMLITER